MIRYVVLSVWWRLAAVCELIGWTFRGCPKKTIQINNRVYTLSTPETISIMWGEHYYKHMWEFIERDLVYKNIRSRKLFDKMIVKDGELISNDNDKENSS